MSRLCSEGFAEEDSALDIILLKSLGASVAFLLAVLNLLIMLQLYGKLQLFPGASGSLAWWHRRQGDVIVVLFVLIAYHCVTYGYIDRESPRIMAHSILGGLTLAVIGLKLLTVYWIPRLMSYIAVIGAALFLATTGSVVTSALWFFLTWIQEGTPPSY